MARCCPLRLAGAQAETGRLFGLRRWLQAKRAGLPQALRLFSCSLHPLPATAVNNYMQRAGVCKEF